MAYPSDNHDHHDSSCSMGLRQRVFPVRRVALVPSDSGWIGCDSVFYCHWPGYSPITKRAPSSFRDYSQCSYLPGSHRGEFPRWDSICHIVRKLFCPNHEPISFDTEDCGMTKPLLSVVILGVITSLLLSLTNIYTRNRIEENRLYWQSETTRELLKDRGLSPSKNQDRNNPTCMPWQINKLEVPG